MDLREINNIKKLKRSDVIPGDEIVIYADIAYQLTRIADSPVRLTAIDEAEESTKIFGSQQA